MKKVKKKLKAVIGSILRDRQSTSTNKEDFGPDTLMNVVKKELNILKDHQAAYDIRYQENPLVTTVFSSSLKDSSSQKSLIRSPKVSKNIQRIKKSGRRFVPLLRRYPERMLIRQRNVTWVKYLGIPKRCRTVRISNSKKPVPMELTKKSNDVFLEPALMTPVKKLLDSQGQLDENLQNKTPNEELIDSLKISPRDTDSIDDFEDFTQSPQNGMCSDENLKSPLISTPEGKSKNVFTNLSSDQEKLILTPQSAGKRSINSDVEYDRMCETVQDNDLLPTNFSFEAVELLENFDGINELVDDSVLADILGDNETTNYRNENDISNDPLSFDSIKTTEEKSSNIKTRRKSPRIQSMPDVTNYKESDIESVIGVGKMKTRKFSILNKLMENYEKPEFQSSDSSDAESVNDLKVSETLEEPLSDETIEKLRNINVQLEHEVYKQHMLGRSFCVTLSKQERMQFNKYATLKSGPFSPREDEIIEKNWKRFCELHELDISKQHFFKKKYNGEAFIKRSCERIKFFQFMGNGLPFRSLYSIHSRFIKLHGFLREESIKGRRYTKKEDKQILEYFESPKLGIRKSQILPKLFNRTYESIQQRYYYLKSRKKNDNHDQSVRDIEWTLPLIENFIKNLLNITISDNIIELKDATIPLVVWDKLEKKMNINSKVLRYFWAHQLHMQLFCPKLIYLNDVKIMLIEYLYNTGITKTSEILWTALIKSFDGFTKEFIYELFLRMKKPDKNFNKVKYELLESSFGDMVQYLYETKIPVLKRQNTDRFLPRLSYIDGKIRIIDDYPDNALLKE